MKNLILFIHFAFALAGFRADFFVILLQSGQIFSRFGEFAFFHAFADVPVDERSLGVHQVKLVVESGEDFRDGGGVRNHAHSALYFRQVTTRDNRRRLVVNTALETSRAPIDELDGSLRLDRSDGSVDVFRYDVASVHQAARHVLTVSRIALRHHRGRLERGVGDFSDRELFVVRLFRGNNRRVRGQHEVNSRVRNQVGLELRHVDVQRTVES